MLLLLLNTSLYPVLNFKFELLLLLLLLLLLILLLLAKEELIILSVGLILFTKEIFLCLKFKWFFLFLEVVFILLLVELDKLSNFLSPSNPNSSIGSNSSVSKGNIESCSLNLSNKLYASFLFMLSVTFKLLFFFSSESSSLLRLLLISKSDKLNISCDSSPLIARFELKLILLLIKVLCDAFNKLEADNLYLLSILLLLLSEKIIDSFCWCIVLLLYELELFKFDKRFNLSSFHWYFICKILVEGDPYAVYISPIS